MVMKTLLNEEHKKLGAKMVEFAGWEMPVSYTSIIAEHKNVRENIGIFDVSHMGEFVVTGKDSLNFLNKLVPQDIEKLVAPKAVYCQLLNTEGGVIDDLIIYKIEDEKYLVIVNAARIDEDLNWFVRNSLDFDVCIENKSHNYSLIAVQGPKAVDLIEKLGVRKSDLPEFFSIKKANFLETEMWISRTGYTGEDGVELLMKNNEVQRIWNILLDKGKEFNIMPIGLGARDTLRLEAALHLYGNDMTESTTPIEAGLSWSIPKNKEANYNGKSVIMKQIENGVDKKLIGLEMLDRAIARHEYEIYFNNEKVGFITSGGVSPILNKNIALGYVKNIKDICIDSVVQVKIREKFYDAKIVKKPFVQKRNKV